MSGANASPLGRSNQLKSSAAGLGAANGRRVG
jgi:hypothetical protein